MILLLLLLSPPVAAVAVGARADTVVGHPHGCRCLVVAAAAVAVPAAVVRSHRRQRHPFRIGKVFILRMYPSEGTDKDQNNE